MKERRQHPRIPVTVKVTYVENGRNEVFFSEDLSEGGLFLKSDNPPFVGTVLDLQISIPNVDQLLEIKGDVMWRLEGRGCGVRFFKVTAEKRKLIRNYLTSVVAA
ncbi:MAG: PilZ domain-containing protein [Bdellovibrionota bacterium]